MSLALLRKELREHGWIALATWLLSALLFAVAWKESDMGGLEVLRGYSLGALSLCAIVAANRLVAREYAGRTLLFLETLPVSRGRVLATKCVAALAWVGLPVVAGCGTAAYLASGRETVDAAFLVATSLRVGVYALAFASFAFFAATLGRFRWVAWLTIFTLAVVLETEGQVELDEWPVFALIGRDLGLDRHRSAGMELALAGVVAALSLLGAALLVTVGRGAVAMALAKRMTAREKVFSAIGLLSIFVVSNALGSLRSRPRFVLQEGARARSQQVDVSVARQGGIDQGGAAALAEVLAADAERLVADLAIEERPTPLFAVPHAGLEPDLYVRASLGEKDGIVIQAAFDKPGFDLLDFRAAVASLQLRELSSERAHKPDREWFLRGFALWWAARRTQEDTTRLAERALAAGREFPADGFSRWDEESERLGPCLSTALAWAAVRDLEAAVGAEAVLTLARDALADERHRALAAFVDRPLPRRLADARAPSPETLAAALATAATVEAGRAESLFSRLPTYRAEVKLEDEAGRLRLVQRLEVAPAGAVTRWRVLTTVLAPWTRQLSPLSGRRFDLDVASPAVLPLTPVRGTHVATVLELEDPVLRCVVRPFARRWSL